MNCDLDLDDPFLSSAVEGIEAAGTHGCAPAAGALEPDPDWQPM